LEAAIYNFFKPAVDAIIGALTWLWSNVVSPFIDTLKRLWDTITNNPILAALFGPDNDDRLPDQTLG
jgi:hypothetical protein